METRLGHCLFIVFSEWIWLFTLTSILGGTKAEVRCIPSCQLPLINAFPRELSALDLADLDEVPVEEFVGIIEGSPEAKPTAKEDEKYNIAELPAREESSYKVQPRLERNNTSFPEKDALNSRQKLSQQKVVSGSASASSPVNTDFAHEGKNNSFYVENGAQIDVMGEEDGDVPSWRRTRSARSAEAWSGYRPEEGGEDASFADQEEIQLTSSTFPLTGDTAHNQAMVHWSGQNSSVSSSCAPDLRTVLF